ncbi:inorganic phosphate transporter [Sorangium sp. So ce1000]|uniref:inorganic phosphate transporter n=1 Tax=Sorangium sp. So ce1000 TaxID=3133325 RepID=UPI003F5E5D8F
MKLTKLETHQGFAAEMAAATTITAASTFGIPRSTTHTISTAIMGVGVVRGVRAVRWTVARNLVIAWILPFPICAAISFGAVFATKLVPAPVLLGLVLLVFAAAFLARRPARPSLRASGARA